MGSVRQETLLSRVSIVKACQDVVESGGEDGQLVLATGLGQAIAEARPRVRGRVSVRFLVLPVEGRLGWRVGEAFFAVSKPLLHDLPAFREWFAAQIPQGL